MSRGNIGRWIGPPAWALLDQACFAASNFALGILLGRWLGPETYGAFAIAFTVFLFVGVLHSGLITEPMLVFGAGKYAQCQVPYLSELSRLHWTWGWAASAGMALCGFGLFAATTSAGALLVLAVVAGPMLYLWTWRRACYLPAKPRFAAEGGLLYILVVLGCIWLLRMSGTLSAATGLVTMGLASLAAALLVGWRLTRSKELSNGHPPHRQEILQNHMRYGRWAVLTGVLGWVPGNISLLVLPIWGGTAASGELRAAANLVLPVQQLLAAAGPLMLPLLVRVRSEADFPRRVLLLGAAFTLAPAIWAALLGLVGPQVSTWLYDGQFDLPREVLVILGLQAAVSGGVLVLATGLRALELPRIAFRGYATSCAVSVGVAIPMTLTLGVRGAAVGALAAAVANAAVMLPSFRGAVARRQRAMPC